MLVCLNTLALPQTSDPSRMYPASCPVTAGMAPAPLRRGRKWTDGQIIIIQQPVVQRDNWFSFVFPLLACFFFKCVAGLMFDIYYIFQK